MKRALISGIATLAICGGLTAAYAQAIPDGGLTFDQIVTWLHKAGYKAEIKTDSDGKRNIYSAAEGTNFHISQYDCKAGVCGSMQFWVGFDTKGAFSPARINEWNRKNRWVRAYVDDVNDPWLEYDVDLTPGGTYEILDDQFAIWRGQLKKFSAMVNGD